MAKGKYKRKRERKTQRSITLQMLGLSTRTANLLEKNGINNLADLIQRSEEDLINIPGIGASTIEEIRSGIQRKAMTC